MCIKIYLVISAIEVRLYIISGKIVRIQMSLMLVLFLIQITRVEIIYYLHTRMRL